jgi:hypothetical protein
MTGMRLLTAVLSGLLFSPSAWADLLANGSFEAPAGFAQGAQAAAPPGWKATYSSPDLYSSDGSFGLPPGTYGNFTGVTAQQGLGWVAGWSVVIGSFGQQLPTTLTPNAEYALSGFLIQAKRGDLDHPGAYDLLLNSTNSLAGAVVVATLDPTTDSDNWEFVAETFTAPANAGELPWIIFRSYGPEGGGAYPGLDNISLVPTNVALFDVAVPTAAGPPYPAQAIIADVATQFAQPVPPPITPVERLKLSLFDAAQPSPPAITPLPLAVSTTTAPDAAALDVAFRLIAQPPPILPAESSFDLFFELEAHPDSNIAPVLSPVDPCANCNDAAAFDIFFNVFVDGVGTMRHAAHFATGAGQPLVFDNVVVGPPQSPAFHVTFDLLQTGGQVITAENLFNVTITSEVTLPGDFNNDGTVDAADYVNWRKGLGTNYTQDHYNIWRAHFGEMAAGDSNASLNAAVPEPAALVMLFVGIFPMFFRQRSAV